MRHVLPDQNLIAIYCAVHCNYFSPIVSVVTISPDITILFTTRIKKLYSTREKLLTR